MKEGAWKIVVVDKERSFSLKTLRIYRAYLLVLLDYRKVAKNIRFLIMMCVWFIRNYVSAINYTAIKKNKREMKKKKILSSYQKVIQKFSMIENILFLRLKDKGQLFLYNN